MVTIGDAGSLSNTSWLYNFRVFDIMKFVTFQWSWGQILELYAKAKSYLISQQVQFFNKKSKKIRLYVPFVCMGFNCLYATEPKQGTSFLFVTKSQEFLIFIWLAKEGSKSESQLGVTQLFWTQDPQIGKSTQTTRPLLVK